MCGKGEQRHEEVVPSLPAAGEAPARTAASFAVPSTAASPAGELAALRTRLAAMEGANAALQCELEHVRAEKVAETEALKAQNEALRGEIEALKNNRTSSSAVAAE